MEVVANWARKYSGWPVIRDCPDRPNVPRRASDSKSFHAGFVRKFQARGLILNLGLDEWFARRAWRPGAQRELKVATVRVAAAVR